MVDAVKEQGWDAEVILYTDEKRNEIFAYYTAEGFKEKFPQSVSYSIRVLKQNRGSTGEGIWRVEAAWHPGKSGRSDHFLGDGGGRRILTVSTRGAMRLYPDG